MGDACKREQPPLPRRLFQYGHCPPQLYRQEGLKPSARIEYTPSASLFARGISRARGAMAAGAISGNKAPELDHFKAITYEKSCATFFAKCAAQCACHSKCIHLEEEECS